MKRVDQKRYLLANIVTVIVFIIALIGVWYFKNMLFVLLALPPVLLLIFLGKQMNAKYHLGPEMRANWERDTLINILIIITMMLAKEYWIAILVSAALLILLMFLTFQSNTKALSH